jgi:hypothetical protein
VINADGWLNFPHVRFHRQDSARHFYENAIRFDEMFERVILPLRTTRNINVESDFAEETATTFRKHRYAFRNKVPEIVRSAPVSITGSMIERIFTVTFVAPRLETPRRPDKGLYP